MKNTIDSQTEDQGMNIWVVVLMFFVAYAIWIIFFTVSELGGVSGLDIETYIEYLRKLGVSETTFIEAIGATLGWPLIHIGMLALFRVKKSRAERKQILFNWFLVIACLGIFALLIPA